MIIKCNNCNKNFDIDSGLIPERGRLLQCSVCDHKWFFKKEIKEKSVPIVIIKDEVGEPTPHIEDVTRVEKENSKTIELLDSVTDNIRAIEATTIQNNIQAKEIIRKDKLLNIKKTASEKIYNILSLTIVLIISFIAIIIVLDTFQRPISTFVPNIESLLYNLYETINDIVLFFSDLI